MSGERPKLIVAGTHEQARYWAEQWKIGKWRFVGDPIHLRGVTKADDIVFAGTYGSRKDIAEIFDQVAIIRATEKK